MSDEPASPGLWSAVHREPLVLFLVLGALLFGAWGGAGTEPDRQTIRVEGETCCAPGRPSRRTCSADR